jgi:cell division inhibitor SulA
VPIPSTTANQHAETTEATTSNPAEAVDAAVRAACKGRSHAVKSGLVEAVRAGARQQLAQAHTTHKANDPTSKLASCADMTARACSWLIEKALP